MDNVSIKYGRLSKEEKYVIERKNILKQINDIIEIKDERFFVCDIDDEKIRKIQELKNDIQKYFLINNTRAFGSGVDKEHLCLIKLVYSQMGIKLIRAQMNVIRSNKKISTGCYMIEK